MESSDLTFSSPKIHHRVYIAKAVEQVFEHLTRASDWNAWFTTECEIGSKLGDPIRFVWKDYGVDHLDLSDSGRIIAFEAPLTFGFTWRPGESETSVQFTLTPRGSGTIVALVESGYTDSPKDFEAFQSCSVGWGEALTLFKFYLEHGVTYGPIPEEQS